MRFSKWQGLGNDYIIADEADLPFDLDPRRCALLCDRHFGIGGDGILVNCSPTGAIAEAVARMRIFNPDGSEPEMCGNGIRMFALYLREKGLVGEGEVVVETLAGAIRPRILTDGRVRVHMGTARHNSPAIDSSLWGDHTDVVQKELEAAGSTYTFTFVDVGNPHCIIVSDDVPSVDLAHIGPLIENHPLFPRRANVEFIRSEDDGSVTMRVWERGVGETQACGTGATAVGVAAVRLGMAESPVTVHLPGGDLEIEVYDDGQAIMVGPAEQVYSGEASPALSGRLDPRT
jgi:diaminopimelate epimerase